MPRLRAALALASTLALALASSACRKQADRDAALATLNDFKTKACACKTPDCAAGVEKEMFDWSDKHAAEAAAWAKHEALMRDVNRLAEATKQCLDTAKGGGAAVAPAPGSGAGGAQPGTGAAPTPAEAGSAATVTGSPAGSSAAGPGSGSGSAQ